MGVYKIFKSLKPETYIIEDPAKALRKALELSKGSQPILVTGSFYMICEIRRFFPLTYQNHDIRSHLD